jgi:hypothetical protein
LINYKRIFFFIFICTGFTTSFCEEIELYPKYKVYVGPGRWRNIPPKKGVDFAKLNSETIDNLIDGASSSEIKSLLSSYIDNTEKICQEKGWLSDELKDWFSNNSKIREAFFQSLDPVYDNIPKAIKIFEELKNLSESKIKTYYHLAIAIAIVWDNDDAITSSRFECIWGFQNNQFQELQSYTAIYEYFTKRSIQSSLKFKPDKLRWPLLVHMVDMDISAEEMKWALKTKSKYKNSVDKAYSLIKYDYQKLSTKTPNIGNRPYTLQNILQYNGICGDQAHFSSRLGKTFGIPAMKVSGDGRYGGAHAWLGYLVASKGAPKLVFSGRYRGDMYYTGDVFDPQTRTSILERHVAMMYEGASSAYSKYIESIVLARIAKYYRDEEPAASYALSKEAVERNHFSKPAWDILFWHLSKEGIEIKEVLKIMNDLFKDLKYHPDVTFEGIQILLKRFEQDDIKSKEKYINKVLPLYKNRPDLQIKLRKLQCESLKDTGNALKTIQIALKTCLSNTEESTLILPLIKTIVDITLEKKVERKVKPYLQKIEAKFPKKRGNTTSKAYLKLKEIIAPVI